MGYRKKREVRENKRAKSSSVQKKREREREKIARPSQKEARGEKLLEGVHMHILIN